MPNHYKIYPKTSEGMAYSKAIQGAQPIIEGRTYPAVYAASATQTAGTFYFMSVFPDSYNAVWHIRYKVTATVSGQPYYSGHFIVDLTGTASTYVAYAAWNGHSSTSYKSIYNHTLLSAKDSAHALDYGHKIGVEIYGAPNYTNSSYARIFSVEVLEEDNCVARLLDSISLISGLSGYNSAQSSNAYNSTTVPNGRFDGQNNGLRETGDDNDVYSIYDTQYKYVSSTSGGILAESLVGNGSDGKLVNILSTNAKEPFDIGKPIYWAASESAAGSSGAWKGFYTINPSISLSVVGAGSLIAITAGDDIYIKCTVPDSTKQNMLLSTGEVINHTTLGAITAEDGYVYYYLGKATGTFSATNTKFFSFQPYHPAVQFKDGSLRPYIPDHKHTIDEITDIADASVARATSDGAGNQISTTYMPKSGGTFTGAVTAYGTVTGGMRYDITSGGNETNAFIKVTENNISGGGGTDYTLLLPNASGTIALTSDIPTKTSDLNNDSGFITSSAVPTKISDLTNDSHFIDISALDNYGYVFNAGSNVFDIWNRSATHKLYIRHQTITFSLSSANSYTGTVSFSSAMPSSNYTVSMERSNNTGYNNYPVHIYSKTTSGFSFYVEYVASKTSTESYDVTAIYSA